MYLCKWVAASPPSSPQNSLRLPFQSSSAVGSVYSVLLPVQPPSSTHPSTPVRFPSAPRPAYYSTPISKHSDSTATPHHITAQHTAKTTAIPSHITHLTDIRQLHTVLRRQLLCSAPRYLDRHDLYPPNTYPVSHGSLSATSLAD